MLEEAKKREITKILLNGDVFEDNSYIDVEVFDATYRRLEALHEAGMEMVINLGNHDISRQSGRRILHALRAFRKIATIVEKPTLVWDYLFVVPWDSSPDRIKEAIRSCKNPEDKILVGHFGVQGATTGPNSYLARNPIKLRDVRYSEFRFVILSDYHTRQRLARNCYYLGSPIQHTFGEIHTPCVWGFSVGRGSIRPRMEKIFTPFPRFRRVSAKSEHELSDRTRDFKGSYVQVAAGLRLDERKIERIANQIGFQYVVKREGDEDIEEVETKKSMNINDAIKRYVRREVKSDNIRNRLLQLGKKLYEGEI